MENKEYTFKIDGKTITVTAQEAQEFYPIQYALTEKDIEKYAAEYTTRIKSYKQCVSYLSKELVERLLHEERFMKEGETDYFRHKMDFDWYICIKKERTEYTNYTISACCLDNIQTHSRRYKTLSDAILHCLNNFNENASIKNKYQSIEDYLSR